MKKVLLVQPSLQPPGGSKGVGAWILEALKQEHAVSVLTWTPVDFASINRYYGTSLRAVEVTMCQVHPFVRWLINLLPIPLGFLKTNLLLRLCKRMKDDYDVIISASYEADLGRRGIQYINFPGAYQPHPDVDRRRDLFSSTLIEAYSRLCMRISGFSFDRMKQNLTLVNSQWIGTKVRERYGIEATTLYPPVPGSFPEVPWEERENGFVCIGRITPEKELERVIECLVAVRAQGWDIHLHIVGGPEHPRYYKRILQKVREHASWIFLDEHLSREELVQLVSMHRYGIHGMGEEHFGMAVAELVLGGCIAFVPRGGGQVEIVGEEERLLYRTVEEGVAKIVRVMSDPDVQRSLRHALSSRQELFSTTRFMHRIRDLVRRFGDT